MSIRPLPPALAEKARVELNEDPNRLKDDLQHLKDWIAKQPHLKARTDDQWLVTFLRGCKYSLERTKEKIDLYYTIRSTAPELYAIKHTDPRFDEILSLGIFLPLVKKNSIDGTKVSLMRMGKFDPEKYNIVDIMSVTNHLLKIALIEDDEGVINGFRNVGDFEGLTMAHMLQFTPTLMKKMVVLGQDAAPVRMKGSHYLNVSSIFETLFNAAKALLNEKNRNRVYVHNKNYEELYQYVSKDILPAEYGGNGGTSEEIIDHWRRKVKEYSAWLEEDVQYGTDESKRPGKAKTSENMFGVEGSFRQLEFD